MELIIRNRDDILSRLGTWGVYMLPLYANCDPSYPLWWFAPGYSGYTRLSHNDYTRLAQRVDKDGSEAVDYAGITSQLDNGGEVNEAI